MKVACFILYFKASQNNITIYFSICPPSTAITRSIRPLKLSAAARNFFCGILAQALTRDNFKDSTFVCGERQASVSNMDHTLNSVGLRSGDEGAFGVPPYPLSNGFDVAFRTTWARASAFGTIFGVAELLARASPHHKLCILVLSAALLFLIWASPRDEVQ